MKKTGYFAVVFCLCLTATAFAKEESILKDNEYGGITKVVTFSKKDAEYKKGIKKLVTAYDEMKNKIMVEVYGFDKRGNYFDQNNLLYKREYYLRKESIFAKLGVHKRVVYYDNNGRIAGSEDLDRVGNVIKIQLEDYKRSQKSKGR